MCRDSCSSTFNAVPLTAADSTAVVDMNVSINIMTMFKYQGLILNFNSTRNATASSLLKTQNSILNA